MGREKRGKGRRTSEERGREEKRSGGMKGEEFAGVGTTKLEYVEKGIKMGKRKRGGGRGGSEEKKEKEKKRKKEKKKKKEKRKKGYVVPK